MGNDDHYRHGMRPAASESRDGRPRGRATGATRQQPMPPKPPVMRPPADARSRGSGQRSRDDMPGRAARRAETDFDQADAAEVGVLDRFLNKLPEISGRRAKLLFWVGAAITPVAVLLLMVSSGVFPLRVAAVLSVLGTVCMGLSVVLREDPTVMCDENADELHSEIKVLRDQVASLHHSLEVTVNRELNTLRGEIVGLLPPARNTYNNGAVYGGYPNTAPPSATTYPVNSGGARANAAENISPPPMSPAKGTRRGYAEDPPVYTGDYHTTDYFPDVHTVEPIKEEYARRERATKYTAPSDYGQDVYQSRAPKLLPPADPSRGGLSQPEDESGFANALVTHQVELSRSTNSEYSAGSYQPPRHGGGEYRISSRAPERETTRPLDQRSRRSVERENGQVIQPRDGRAAGGRHSGGSDW